MSYAQDMIDSFKNEDKPEETVANETPVETPVDTVEAKTEDSPKEETSTEETHTEETTEETHTEEKPEDKPDDKQAEEKPPKPDLSKLTKEQKAEHAFQRQLAKQKAKYESSIEDVKNSFKSEIEELKKAIIKPKEEPVKTRADFPADEGGDDAYIAYLTQRGVDSALAEKEAKETAEAAERKKQQEAMEAQQREVADRFNGYAQAAFGEGYGAFTKLVNKGVANGLAEVLDEAPAVRDFVFGSPEGPVVLNEMLQNKDAFVRIMSRGGNPMEAVIECHDLAKEIAARAKAPAEEVAPQPKMPPIGKPGAGAGGTTAPNMFKDDASLIDFVRRRKYGG